MEQGRLEPVETRVKNNKRGLGSKEPKAKPKPKVEDDVEKDPKKPKVNQVCDSSNVYILFLLPLNSFLVLLHNIANLTISLTF